MKNAFRLQCTSFDGFPIDEFFRSEKSARGYGTFCGASFSNVEMVEVSDSFNDYTDGEVK